MNTVIYTDDMEPITVINIDAWTEKFLNEHGSVRLAVMPIFPINYEDKSAGLVQSFNIVSIRAERFHRKGKTHTFLITEDEETALLLKAAFLPGQNREVQQRERDAMAKGFLQALSMIGRNL